MPKSQLLFSAVFGFRNPTKEIFSELDEINARGLFLHEASRRPEGRRSGATRRRGPGAGRAALACGPLVWPPDLPFRLHIVFVAKPPSTESHDTENLPEAPPPPIPSWGIQEIASGTLPERGIITGGLYIIMPASGLMRE